MSHALLEQNIYDYFDQPSARRFRLLQTRVQAVADYDPQAQAVLAIEELARHKDPEVVLDEADELPTQFLLCPRYHFLQAVASDRIGDHESRDWFVDQMQSCLNGLLATGDGTSESPYRITFLLDQRDLLQSLRCEALARQLVRTPQGICDVATISGGGEVWFDVSKLVALLPTPQLIRA